MTVFNDELYGGATGTGGEQGSCSRMAKLTPAGWEMIVDANIDGNDTGTNENGFGDGMECDMNTGNFMPWSIETFNDKLMVAINSLGGLRMLYSETGSADDADFDPTWKYSVGGDLLIESAVTNSEGYYSFGGIAEGRYLFVVEGIGYSFVSESGWVDIPQGPIQSYDFTSYAN